MYAAVSACMLVKSVVQSSVQYSMDGGRFIAGPDFRNARYFIIRYLTLRLDRWKIAND